MVYGVSYLYIHATCAAFVPSSLVALGRIMLQLARGIQVRTMAMFVVLFRSVGRCRDADSVIVY